MPRSAATSTTPSVPGRPGRRPDPTLDDALLRATLEVVTEVGYDRTTMDLVAERAGTTKSALYRRWPSKGALTLAAVALLQEPETDLDRLPDEGSLRADLLALTAPYDTEAGRLKLRLMAGLSSQLGAEPELADAVTQVLVEPWVGVCRRIVERAIARGEAVSPDPDLVARVVPSMTAHRLVVERRPVDRDFFVGLIDAVVVPALRP